MNVATVSNLGLITGVRVGETYVTVSSTDGTLKDRAKVIITAKYNLYKVPYLGFGAITNEVKAMETSVLVGMSVDSTLGLVVVYFEDTGLKSTSLPIELYEKTISNMRNQKY